MGMSSPRAATSVATMIGRAPERNCASACGASPLFSSGRWASSGQHAARPRAARYLSHGVWYAFCHLLWLCSSAQCFTGAGWFGMHSQHFGIDILLNKGAGQRECSLLLLREPVWRRISSLEGSGSTAWHHAKGGIHGGAAHVFALLLRAVAVDGDGGVIVLQQEVLDGVRVALGGHEYQRQALRSQVGTAALNILHTVTSRYPATGNCCWLGSPAQGP